MANILFENEGGSEQRPADEPKTDATARNATNIFLRTDIVSVEGLPDWDITPPTQFINPRSSVQ